ncbi:MAG: hypothetical protein KBT83_04530 [Marinobacter sp.]|nr:hypothetical protein [Marinobacter sp.]
MIRHTWRKYACKTCEDVSSSHPCRCNSCQIPGRLATSTSGNKHSSGWALICPKARSRPAAWTKH